MAQEKFLIDANAFITPHLQYYPFDLAPSFWQQLENPIKDGTIVVLDMVKAEVLQGTDSLRSWMDTLEIGELVDRKDIRSDRLHTIVWNTYITGLLNGSNLSYYRTMGAIDQAFAQSPYLKK